MQLENCENETIPFSSNTESTNPKVMQSASDFHHNKLPTRQIHWFSVIPFVVKHVREWTWPQSCPCHARLVDSDKKGEVLDLKSRADKNQSVKVNLSWEKIIRVHFTFNSEESRVGPDDCQFDVCLLKGIKIMVTERNGTTAAWVIGYWVLTCTLYDCRFAVLTRPFPTVVLFPDLARSCTGTTIVPPSEFRKCQSGCINPWHWLLQHTSADCWLQRNMSWQ